MLRSRLKSLPEECIGLISAFELRPGNVRRGHGLNVGCSPEAL